jgi:UDP-N-acetylmuramyl pentapeptide phosphotransferase/UDP-N-acetylglucosamine-1-phosphate transferase
MIFSLFFSLAALGFLIYNLPPARIFMGDIGSASLGFAAASVTLWGVKDELFEIWVPLLIFSPFIVDSTVTLLKRTFRREKIWKAHREHYYQRLVLAGWGHKKTIVMEYVLIIAAGLSGLLYGQLNRAFQFVTLLCWVFIYIALGLGVQMVERQQKTLLKEL